VRQLYRIALGRHETGAQEVAIYELSDGFAERELDIRALAEALIMSPAFRAAGEPR
jgi:hypothetical protein